MILDIIIIFLIIIILLKIKIKENMSDVIDDNQIKQYFEKFIKSIKYLSLVTKKFKTNEFIEINSDTLMEKGLILSKKIDINKSDESPPDILKIKHVDNEYLYVNNNLSLGIWKTDNKPLNHLKSNLVPSGTIVAYNSTSPPKGWLLCNGENGTPNLINRFILGASNNQDINKTGGEPVVKLSISNLPSHSHSNCRMDESNWTHSHNYIHPWKGGNNVQDGGNYWKRANKTTGSSGNHTHSYSVGNKGGSQSHNNMPPYYVLTYIMKI